MKTCQHIHSKVLVTWLLIATNGSMARDCYHVFTDVSGRSIKGQLVAFDAGSQLVTIKRDDDKKCRVRMNVFSNDDQKYIREQSLRKDYMHSIIITARLAETGSTESNYGARYKTEYIKFLNYEVILENRSTSLFKEIDVKYCIFYRQGTRNRQGMNFVHGVQFGHWKLDLVKPGSRLILETETIALYDEECEVTLFGSGDGAKGEIVGIWVRATTVLPHGKRLVRELCRPDHIRRSEDWTDKTRSVGLNNPDERVASYP